MYAFTSDQSFTITGRGRVWHFDGKSEGQTCPEEIGDPVRLQGLTILINEEEYVCKGVETFCVYRDPLVGKYKMAFGILV